MRFHDAVLIFLSSGSLAFRLIVNNSLTRIRFDLSDMRPPRGSKKLNELLSLRSEPKIRVNVSSVFELLFMALFDASLLVPVGLS